MTDYTIKLPEGMTAAEAAFRGIPIYFPKEPPKTRYTLRHVPVINAIRLPPMLSDDADEQQYSEYEDQIDACIEFFEKTHLEYESDDDCGIIYRRRQSMSEDDWVRVDAGDWLIAGAFDHETMKHEDFVAYYKPCDD